MADERTTSSAPASSGSRPSGPATSGSRPSGPASSGSRPSGPASSGSRPSGPPRPGGGRPGGGRPGGGRPGGGRPGGSSGGYRGRSGGRGGQRRFMRRQRRKVCSFCADKQIVIDYKNASRLRQLMSDRGKILPRRQTGTCAKHQRKVTEAIQRARYLALLPYTDD